MISRYPCNLLDEIKKTLIIGFSLKIDTVIKLIIYKTYIIFAIPPPMAVLICLKRPSNYHV